MTNKPNQLSFRVSSGLKNIIGKDLISDKYIAIFELVKNSYDAKAHNVKISFLEDDHGMPYISISDNGVGMNYEDIKNQWMHVGKSFKEYIANHEKQRPRVLAGSKGIGRFALARLGMSSIMFSKKKGCQCVKWETDWNSSTISFSEEIADVGTTILINDLRSKWNSKKVKQLSEFLSKTYNDDVMSISVTHEGKIYSINPYFPERVPGVNCLSTISLKYDSKTKILSTQVVSDEFLDEATTYCSDIDLNNFSSTILKINENSD